MTNERRFHAGFALMALVSGLCASTQAAGQDAAPSMEKCAKTLGVVRIEEDTGAEWYRYYVGRLGSTAPVISAMVMESNCFVVVERGTGERGINAETARARGDEARESGTRGKGQQGRPASHRCRPLVSACQRAGIMSREVMTGRERCGRGSLVRCVSAC